jgi:hypothetical protein
VRLMETKMSAQANLGGFLKEEIAPRFSPDFKFVKSPPSLVRADGNFIQAMILSAGRDGLVVKVWPTFYVVGACPWDDVVPQTISLPVERPNDWRFAEPLGHQLAQKIIALTARTSPLSFERAIEQGMAKSTLQQFERGDPTGIASLYLGFFLMAEGKEDPEHSLQRSKKKFCANNVPVRHDWQRAMLSRIEELISRAKHEGTRFARAEAADHAELLRLPKPTW